MYRDGWKMLRKFSEEKLEEILEVGIAEFAEAGLERANTNVIAKKAGISVGVLFKYYKDKEAFFMSCLKKSLEVLEQVVADALEGDGTILSRADKLIRSVQKHSRENSNYIKLYNQITSGNHGPSQKLLADKIEGISAKAYVSFIEKTQAEGNIRSDADPKLFAFFFDNLLMLLQFSYSCDYYIERFRIYCGDDILERDDLVAKQLLMFFESAFTFESKKGFTNEIRNSI